MNSRTLIGLVLTLIGLAIILYGMGMAIMELVTLYSSQLNNAMDEVPGKGGEQGVSDRMIRDVIIGACGLPFTIAGAVFLKLGFYARLRKKVGKR